MPTDTIQAYIMIESRQLDSQSIVDIVIDVYGNLHLRKKLR